MKLCIHLDIKTVDLEERKASLSFYHAGGTDEVIVLCDACSRSADRDGDARYSIATTVYAGDDRF